MIDLKAIQNSDPVKRMVERQTEQEEYSPMDPPDAYRPPVSESIPYEQMPAPIRTFTDEHREFLGVLDTFERVLTRLGEEGMTRGVVEEGAVPDFFRYFDERIVPHAVKEEKILFPFLQARLLERGEHSRGTVPTSAVDMLEDDHAKHLQLAAVAFSLLALSVRLPDAPSRSVLLDAAIEQCKTLVEALRLHMFREDHVVFPMAVRFLTEAEFDEMELRMRQSSTSGPSKR